MRHFDLADSCFAHCNYSNNPLQEARELRWNRDLANPASKTIFITDRTIPHFAGLQGRFKVAWLLEPRELNPALYDWVIANHGMFDVVMSHDVDAMSHLPNFLWVPFGGCWIPESNWGYPGDRTGVSIVASEKRQTIGHCLMHTVIAENSGLEVMGRGYKPINSKLESMKTGFQVVIENSSRNGYFTEKLIDCLITGTVPIYYGCPNLEDYGFNMGGILHCSDKEAINASISLALISDPVLLAIEIADNIRVAQRYILAENYIYDKYNNLLP
jgi:hypothetical protein